MEFHVWALGVVVWQHSEWIEFHLQRCSFHSCQVLSHIETSELPMGMTCAVGQWIELLMLVRAGLINLGDIKGYKVGYAFVDSV